jgi:hypothetical protein
VLAGVAAGIGTLSGCFERPPRRTSRAILVTNETDDTVTVTLRVDTRPAITTSATENATAAPTATAAGAGTAPEQHPPTGTPDPVLVHRVDLAPDDVVGVGGDALPSGDLRVRVATTDGQSKSHDWARLDERSTLDGRIGPNPVGFTEID